MRYRKIDNLSFNRDTDENWFTVGAVDEGETGLALVCGECQYARQIQEEVRQVHGQWGSVGLGSQERSCVDPTASCRPLFVPTLLYCRVMGQVKLG